MKERLYERTKSLKKLNEGDNVVIQNQTGNYPLRWDKTGVIIEAKGFDQYHVMMHGSRRITLRNRKFLRKIDNPTTRFTRSPSSPGNAWRKRRRRKPPGLAIIGHKAE